MRINILKKFIALFLTFVIIFLMSSCVSSNATNGENDAVSYTEKQKKEQDLEQYELVVNNKTFSLSFYDNETTDLLKSKLPLTISMDELNGNEKYSYMDFSLPKNEISPDYIENGDLMLFGSNCIVLFYKSFKTSYSYTKIGKVENSKELNSALKSGSVQVTIQKK